MQVVIVLAVALGAALGIGVAVVVTAGRRRAEPAAGAALERAMAALRENAGAERDAAIRSALEQVALLTRQQLDAGLAAGRREVTATNEQAEARLEQVERRVRDELGRVGELVTQLGQRHAASIRGVEATLAAHAE